MLRFFERPLNTLVRSFINLTKCTNMPYINRMIGYKVGNWNKNIIQNVSRTRWIVNKKCNVTKIVSATSIYSNEDQEKH